VTLDDVAAQLYALPPEEFTAARGEAVAAARQAGDRELAGQIGALRRPTVGAWLVNLLAHQRPDLIADLLALGDSMRSAQRNLRGDELRTLSGQRRSMVSALARESRALAVAAGRGVRAVLPLGEVENTLTAALADADVAEEVRLGRLVKPVEYAGFGEHPRPQLRLVQGGAAAPTRDRGRPAPEETAPVKTAPGKAAPGRTAPVKAAPGKPGQVSRISDKRDAAARKADRDAEARQAAEREAADREATEQQKEAERRAVEREAARQRAAELRRRQQSAHRELLAARTALAEAEAQRTAAEKAVRDARRRVEKAQAAVEAARPDE
jgi:hypothetical protein